MNDKVTPDDHDALERRLTRSEQEISQLASMMGEQGKNIASMTTAIETQTNQIGSLLHKSGRPFPMPTLIMGIMLAVTMTTLALAPLYRGLDRGDEAHQRSLQHAIEDSYRHGYDESDIKWLKDMEKRNYEALHSGIYSNDLNK